MAKRSRYAERASVPIPRAVAEAPRRPERVGLPKGTSAAQVYSRVMEIGWRYVLESEIGRDELTAYAAYAKEPEAREAVLALQRAALKGGVL